MADYYKYQYSGSDQITVQEFIESDDTPINVEMDAQEFLKYGEDGAQNIDFIANKYNKIQLKLYGSEIGSNSSDLIIVPGTSVLLPKDNTDIEKILLYDEGQFLKQGDFEFYLGDYNDLLKNKDTTYKRSQEYTINGNGIDVRALNENIQVWIWCRAIDKIVDITPFVNSCTTNKQDIGSFSLSLNPTLDIEEITRIGNDYIDLFSIQDNDGKHHIDFFEKNLQQNDVVFIRFEQLERDKDFDTFTDNKFSLYRDTYSLKNSTEGKERVWDMIGLVDMPTTSYTALSTDKSISVTGRDLMKLLVEDGSYFLPYLYIEGKDTKDKFVWGGDVSDSWFKRNVLDGSFQSFFSYEMKGIGDSLKFIVNHLSNLGVTPNKLWDAYGDDRTIIYNELKGVEDEGLQKLEVNGIWNIIKFAIDKNIVDRRISGTGLMNPDGTLYEFFNNICQKPFVEFWGDTYTDTFDFIVRQPPFTKNAIQQVLQKEQYITVKKEDLLSYSLAFDNTFYSHFQIEPQSEWMGVDKGTFTAIIPIIYLPQYADTFGNKRMYVKDSYIDRTVIYGTQEDDKKQTLIESILNDYKFLIETNAYLPFTRKGTITLNGDRRIKKGSFILNEVTSELFYVDGVNNSFSATSRQINRTTRLTVSRGMKINNILSNVGVNRTTQLLNTDNKTTSPSTSNPSYFDIVNSDAITTDILNKVKNSQKGVDVKVKKGTSTNFSVDDDIFNYFLTRKHFV